MSEKIKRLFDELHEISTKPRPFEFYTASELWTDEYTSQRMLEFHLNEQIDVASRNAAFIRRSVDWMQTHFHIGQKTKIADFGCGPGLYAIELAKLGADVTGIDFSQRSIQYAMDAASRHGLTVNYIHRNYLEFETDERFDLIVMLMCDFCALSPEQRGSLLRKFRKLLKPDGSILLDVYSYQAFDKRAEMSIFAENLLHGFWSPEKYYGFQGSVKYETAKVVLDKYTIIEPARMRTIYNWLQYFSLEVMQKEFLESGLIITEHYKDVAGTPFKQEADEFAVVAVSK